MSRQSSNHRTLSRLSPASASRCSISWNTRLSMILAQLASCMHQEGLQSSSYRPLRFPKTLEMNNEGCRSWHHIYATGVEYFDLSHSMIRGSRQKAHGRCIQVPQEWVESGSWLTACDAGMVLSRFSQIWELSYSNCPPSLCCVGEAFRRMGICSLPESLYPLEMVAQSLSEPHESSHSRTAMRTMQDSLSLVSVLLHRNWLLM
jgi:hypothetical protein